jgi:hypothetical protein
MPRTLKTIVAAASLSLASIAAGQEGLGLGTQDENAPKEAPRPPIARKADQNPPALWNLGAFIIILGAVFGANMIPSKRGHQD